MSLSYTLLSTPHKMLSAVLVLVMRTLVAPTCNDIHTSKDIQTSIHSGQVLNHSSLDAAAVAVAVAVAPAASRSNSSCKW
jgi:hypothetical protein